MSLSDVADSNTIAERHVDRNNTVVHGVDLLQQLEDEATRTLLSAMSLDWHTAQELSSLSQTPLSTTYRKVNALHDAGVLLRRLRINESGKHPEEYRCKPIVLTLRLGTQAGLEVSVSSAFTDW